MHDDLKKKRRVMKFSKAICGITITILCFSNVFGLTIIHRPFLNFNERIDKTTNKLVTKPQFIILHYTANCSLSKTIQLFYDYFRPVSTHYVIGADGKIVQMVDESKRAWHADRSAWRKNKQINTYSIGIEITNPGYTETLTNPCSIFDPHVWNIKTAKQVAGSSFYWHPFTQKQIKSVIDLCKDIMQRYDIAPQNILGHSDIAPGRKMDPGPLFPWRLLAKNNIGIWPHDIQHIVPQTILETQKSLKRLGYKIELSNQLDPETKRVLQAFQSHFRQNNIDGVADQETVGTLANLLEQLENQIINI